MDRTRKPFILKDGRLIVNLNCPPAMPWPENHPPVRVMRIVDTNGWVCVEKQGDQLYVDGKEVVLYLSEMQKECIYDHGMRDCNLFEKLANKPVLHPNIMDALFENQHLIPERWKKDADGNPLCIFFWGVVYEIEKFPGNPVVRCLLFDEQWIKMHDFPAKRGFNDTSPAAMLKE